MATASTGSTVVVALPAANRDAAAFPDPDRLDLTRNVRGHLAFGHGVHKCIGQYLSRETLRVAYPALLNRFPGLRLAVPREERLVTRVHDREVKQDLLQLRDRAAEASLLRAEPALTAETGGAGLAMMISRSRADVLTVAMRSSTSTRPQ